MKKTIILIILFVSVTLFSQEQSKENYQLLQLSLKQKNYYSGSIDGIIGQGTKEAITNFQSDNNLPITSELGEEADEIAKKLKTVKSDLIPVRLVSHHLRLWVFWLITKMKIL